MFLLETACRMVLNKQTPTSYNGRLSSVQSRVTSVRYFSTFCFRRILSWSSSRTISSSKLPMCISTTRFLADLCSPMIPISSHMATSFSIPPSTLWCNSASVSILHKNNKTTITFKSCTHPFSVVHNRQMRKRKITQNKLHLSINTRLRPGHVTCKK